MIKPSNLRAHLTAALPELARDPERLLMFVVQGNVQAAATKALSWQYGYTLRLVFLDWTQHADAVMAPLLAWLKVHQYELLANPDRKGIRFEVEYLNTQSMDMVIDLDLTERVLARPRDGVPGALDLHHLDDTPPLHMPKDEVWTVFIQGEQVAQWHYKAVEGST